MIFVNTLDGGFRSLLAETTIEHRIYFVILEHFCDRMISYIEALPPGDPISITLQEVSVYANRLRTGESSSSFSGED